MSAQPRPNIVRLSELKSGERGTFFALLADRSRSSTGKGNPFFNCRFRDARRIATYMVWGDGPHFEECETNWKPGQFFKIDGVYSEHVRYGPQFEVKKIRLVEPRDEAEGFSETDFIEGARFKPELLISELRELIQATIADEPLRRLTLGLIDAHAVALKELPATDRKFYPYRGGWLEHTLNVAQNVLWLGDQYRLRFPDLKPPINRDLLAAGAVLHDIGRVVELQPGATIVEPAEPTVPGRLLGHLFLGRDLVRDAAREQGDVNPELLQLLEHLMISHLNHPEWGSPRQPLIPEALILHHADDMDAKMEMYTRCLTRDPSPGPFTERDPVLGRHLLKKREV
jgi:3'-5' exoribonuclease